MFDTVAVLVSDGVDAPVADSVDAGDTVLIELAVKEGDAVCAEDIDAVADMEQFAVTDEVLVISAVPVLESDEVLVLVTAGEPVLVIDAVALDEDVADKLVVALDVDTGVPDTATCPVRLKLRSVPAQMEVG